MKNWDPLVLGPALAILRIPAPVCFNAGWISSANFSLGHISYSGKCNGASTHKSTDRRDLFPFWVLARFLPTGALRVASLYHEVWYYSMELHD